MQAIGYRPAHGLRASIRPRARPNSFVRSAAAQAISASAAKAALQFIKGVDESCVPDVKLTRSRTGGSGTAVFIFDNPDVFNATAQMGDITGLYMVDEEGVLSTVEVSARFVNGTPKAVEAKYVMRSAFEWDRFMRFMDRYAASNGLGFTKAGQ